jgi:hypothetical protein
MISKRGATRMTVAKLITYILLIVILALVIYGISVKGFGPLIERVGGAANEVLLLFGWAEDVSEQECLDPYMVDIEKVGGGMFTACRTYCKVDLEDEKGNFKLEGGVFSKYYSGVWGSPGTSSPSYYPSADKLEAYWNANNDLMNKLREVLGDGLSNDDFNDKLRSLFNAKPQPLIFKIDGNGQDWYVLWQEGKWYDDASSAYLRHKRRPYGENWDDDYALNYIYEHSDDIFDDEVYWKIGDRGEYKILPGMEGSAGQIDSSDDYNTFKIWFERMKKDLIEKGLPDAELFEELKQGVEGSSFKLEKQEEYPVFFVPLEEVKAGVMQNTWWGADSTYNPKYPLRLATYSEKYKQWVPIENNYVLNFLGLNKESTLKLLNNIRIYEFLKSKCP